VRKLNELFAVSQEETDNQPTSNLAQASTGAPPGDGFHYPEQDYDENNNEQGESGLTTHTSKTLDFTRQRATSHGCSLHFKRLGFSKSTFYGEKK